MTNDDKPKIEGTAEANSQVKIYDNGNLLATVTADLNGNWSYTPTTALAQGAHVFTVTATDAASNTSSATSWKIIVDSIAPTVPAITLINDDVGSIAGNVANNGVTNDKTPTFSGTGEPGSLVTLYDNGLQMRVILIDRTGTWSHSVPANEALSEGTHRFTLTATDAAGNVVTAPPVIITVDTKAPDAPIISSATDDVGSLQSDLANGGRSDDTLPLLKGTGVADSTITIYDGATPIGTATVTPEGSWSFQVTQPLSEGPHALSAIATDKAGNASSAGNFTLTIDTTPPAAPVITSAEGLIGSETKPLANGGSTKKRQPQAVRHR